MKSRFTSLPVVLPMLMAVAATPALAQSSNGTNTGGGSTAPSAATTPAPTSPQAANSGSPAGSQMGGQMGNQAGADAQFAKDASAGNMAEVKLGQLAEQRGATPAVREFGRWMATDHTMAEDLLQKTAQNMPLSTAPMPQQQTVMSKLQDMHGAQFDRAYIDAMVQDHQETIQKFQTEAQSGSDSALKAYAQQMLPALQQHLDEAQDLQRQGGRYASASTAGDRAVSRLNQNELNKIEKR